MRKSRFLALLLLLPMLLCACSGAGESFVFGKDAHTHLWGAWYDVTPVTCVADGARISYCKICGERYVETVAVAADVTLRAHEFEDTVVPATEALGGYTRRACRTCDYVVERTDEVPALYGLQLPEEPLAPIAEVEAQLCFDTLRMAGHQHNILAAAGVDTAVTAESTMYLATALVAAEALVEEGGLALTSVVYITEQLDGYDPGKLIVGTEVTVERLIDACLDGNNRAAVAALSSVLAEDENAFLELLNGRMARLGVSARFTGLAAMTGTATLRDAAVVLWRVLETEVLAAHMDLGFRYEGKTCVARFAHGNLRLSAVREGEGFRIAAFAGDAIPAAAESELYRGNF